VRDRLFQLAEVAKRPAKEGVAFGSGIGLDRGAELRRSALVLAVEMQDVAGAPGLESAQLGIALLRLRQRGCSDDGEKR